MVFNNLRTVGLISSIKDFSGIILHRFLESFSLLKVIERDLLMSSLCVFNRSFYVYLTHNIYLCESLHRLKERIGDFVCVRDFSWSMVPGRGVGTRLPGDGEPKCDRVNESQNVRNYTCRPSTYVQTMIVKSVEIYIVYLLKCVYFILFHTLIQK